MIAALPAELRCETNDLSARGYALYQSEFYCTRYPESTQVPRNLAQYAHQLRDESFW